MLNHVSSDSKETANRDPEFECQTMINVYIMNEWYIHQVYNMINRFKLS